MLKAVRKQAVFARLKYWMGLGKECSLSHAVLAQITKPSTSEWLVDDGTVKLLNNNLNELIRCTNPFDKVLFRTKEVIRPTEALEISHELEFLSISQATLESQNGDANATIFTCPKSGPVFLVK